MLGTHEGGKGLFNGLVQSAPADQRVTGVLLENTFIVVSQSVLGAKPGGLGSFFEIHILESFNQFSSEFLD